jgi:hypothetical protein
MSNQLSLETVSKPLEHFRSPSLGLKRYKLKEDVLPSQSGFSLMSVKKVTSYRSRAQAAASATIGVDRTQESMKVHAL